ncbi:hypothetical protein ACFQ2B_35765 [Streptomyces stramineus]
MPRLGQEGHQHLTRNARAPAVPPACCRGGRHSGALPKGFPDGVSSSQAAPGLPAAEWWAPLLVDLAAVQRGSAPLGLRVRAVDLTSERAAVTIDWTDGTGTTFRPPRRPTAPHCSVTSPDRGPPTTRRGARHRVLGTWRSGPYAPAQPRLAAGRTGPSQRRLVRVPVRAGGTPARGHRWPGHRDGHGRPRLPRGRGGGPDPLAGLGADGLDIGLAYTIVENAAAADRRTLPPAEPVRGWPGYVSTLPAAPE